MKRLILLMTASLFVFTAVATQPARAGNDDLGKIAAGVVTLFIFGKAIHEMGKKRKIQVTRRPSPPVPPAPINSVPGFNPDKSRLLPFACYFKATGRKGQFGAFGYECLQDRVRMPNRLPDKCLRTVPVTHGSRALVYTAQCLRNHGYRHK